MRSRPLTTTLLLIMTLSAVLAGCGRRGAPEPPSAALTTPDGSKGDQAGKTKPQEPDHPFILDRLIK